LSFFSFFSLQSLIATGVLLPFFLPPLRRSFYRTLRFSFLLFSSCCLHGLEIPFFYSWPLVSFHSFLTSKVNVSLPVSQERKVHMRHLSNVLSFSQILRTTVNTCFSEWLARLDPLLEAQMNYIRQTVLGTCKRRSGHRSAVLIPFFFSSDIEGFAFPFPVFTLPAVFGCSIFSIRCVLIY